MIYFIQDTATFLIKIGFTDGPAEVRLRSLQTGCPGRLMLLATDYGTEETERNLHRQFAGAWDRGEWFRPVPALILTILAARFEQGRMQGFNDGWEACSNIRSQEVLDSCQQEEPCL